MGIRGSNKVKNLQAAGEEPEANAGNILENMGKVIKLGVKKERRKVVKEKGPIA